MYARLWSNDPRNIRIPPKRTTARQPPMTTRLLKSICALSLYAETSSNEKTHSRRASDVRYETES